MANNLGGRCSFRGNSFDYGYDYDLQKYTAYNEDGSVNANAEGMSDIGDDLEVRYYHDDKKVEGAWKNLTAPLEDGGTPISSKEAFEVLLGGNADGSNRTGAYKELEKFFKWIQSCYYAFDMNTQEDRDWVRELLNKDPEMQNGKYYDETGVAYDNDFAQLINSRKTKFETEFEKHLNMEYCLVYYIMTELLLQYDSRGKNMMFASWGPMEVGGEYIWFPIYYDVDT
jgi:hypothetical protein